MEAGKAPRCCSPLGTSGGSEGLEDSDLPKGLTGKSKDMGPTGRHVASLNRNVVEHVRGDETMNVVAEDPIQNAVVVTSQTDDTDAALFKVV